jgi:ferredoxin
MYLGRWSNVPAIKEIAKQCGVSDDETYKSDLSESSAKACILCGKCTRGCDEFTLERIIDFAGKGINRYMTMPYSQVDPHCVSCSSCAYVCPTGAISIVDDRNNPSDPVMIRNAGMKVNAEMATLDTKQCCMREVGTANIVDVMNAYDLLPVMNYRFGSHKDAWKIGKICSRQTMLLKSKTTAVGPVVLWLVPK